VMCRQRESAQVISFWMIIAGVVVRMVFELALMVEK
jgi:hypothetical protein